MTSDLPPGPLKNVVLNVRRCEPSIAVALPVPTIALWHEATFAVCALSRVEPLQLAKYLPFSFRFLSSLRRMSLTAGGWVPSELATAAVRLRVPGLGLALVPGLPDLNPAANVLVVVAAA